MEEGNSSSWVNIHFQVFNLSRVVSPKTIVFGSEDEVLKYYTYKSVMFIVLTDEVW